MKTFKIAPVNDSFGRQFSWIIYQKKGWWIFSRWTYEGGIRDLADLDPVLAHLSIKDKIINMA